MTTILIDNPGEILTGTEAEHLMLLAERTESVCEILMAYPSPVPRIMGNLTVITDDDFIRHIDDALTRGRVVLISSDVESVLDEPRRIKSPHLLALEPDPEVGLTFQQLDVIEEFAS